MFCIQEAFVQVTFSVTRLESRILIHPLAPSLSAPNGESWKSVSDQIMSRVPSTILLEMLVKELNRELKAIGLENINGWVFHSQRTLEVSQLLERYHLRFVALTNGVIADEISNALDHLFSQDPRFQARLSDWDDRKEAVADVTRRVIAQLRFLWQIERLMISDTSALGLRLLIELQDVLYRRLNESTKDAYMMPSTRFKRYEFFWQKMQQFRGLDSRFDCALADYKKALELFPDDGRSLFGERLTQFWNELKQLGLYINNELQRDFFSDSSLYDEDIENLHWTIEDSLLDDVVEEELTEHISQSTPSNQTDFSYSEIEGQQLKLLF